MQAAAEHAERGADPGADQRLAGELRRFAAGVAARAGEDEEEEDEGQRQAVVQPRLEVERVAHGSGDQRRGDDGRGDDRVGRREHRPEQERLGPVEAGEERLRGQRQQRHRDRHRDHQRPRDRAPVAPQQLLLDEHPVGEQGEDQRQLDQLDDRAVAGVDFDHAGQRQRHPQRHREHRGREHRAAHQAGERRDHRQQPPEQQDRLAEADVHAQPSRPRSTRSSASWTVLVAAPLRRLSATIQRSSARSSPGSRRILPTKTSSRPSASAAIG